MCPSDKKDDGDTDRGKRQRNTRQVEVELSVVGRQTDRQRNDVTEERQRDIRADIPTDRQRHREDTEKDTTKGIPHAEYIAPTSSEQGLRSRQPVTHCRSSRSVCLSMSVALFVCPCLSLSRCLS